MSRRNWQECVGARPHMIEAAAVEAGYTARDSYQVVDRIAVIDVYGILVNDSDWWDGWGWSTYGRIAGEVRGAAADPEVDGILLRVNSPGGETDNAFETADLIVATAAVKPVWAVADVSAYSAGYLLASAAERLFVAPKTGGVGSIGVYSLHLDFSKALEKAGVNPTFVEAGEGKTDGHPYKPLSDEARAELQAEVDRLYGMFVDHVARRRKLDASAVRSLGAALKNGADAAIEAGLADRVGGLDVALAQFRGYLDARKENFTFSVAAASATNSPKGGSQMKDEKTKADATAANLAAVPTAPPATEFTVAAANADTEEIIALCAIAGLPAKAAHDFITQKRSVKDVRNALLEMRASEASTTEIVSQVLPNTGSPSKGAGDSPLVKAMENLAGKETK